jgi:hypothetical protein
MIMTSAVTSITSIEPLRSDRTAFRPTAAQKNEMTG